MGTFTTKYDLGEEIYTIRDERENRTLENGVIQATIKQILLRETLAVNYLVEPFERPLDARWVPQCEVFKTEEEARVYLKQDTLNVYRSLLKSARRDAEWSQSSLKNAEDRVQILEEKIKELEQNEQK